MKRKVLFIMLILTLTCGCSLKKEKINYLKESWQLEDALKPNLTFERSNKNDSYGVFYVDSQVAFDSFITYLKTLKDNKFTIDWRYSDVDTIEKLEKSYTDKTAEDSIFKDGYVNFKMCNTEVCFFMQWVDKETYNKLNNQNPTSYSFKLETEKINQANS